MAENKEAETPSIPLRLGVPTPQPFGWRMRIRRPGATSSSPTSCMATLALSVAPADDGPLAGRGRVTYRHYDE